MTAIADQSDIALWGWQVWVIGACLLGLGWLVWSILRAPIEDVDASGLDRLDGVGRIGDQCKRSGHYFRLDLTGTLYTCQNDETVKRFPTNTGGGS